MITRPARVEKMEKMIQGRWGEYTVKIIKSGVRAPPTLPIIPVSPEAVALGVETTVRKITW